MQLVPSKGIRLALALLLALALAGVAIWSLLPLRQVERQPLGLVTSLPIYWADGADIATIIGDDAELPWQRQLLEERYHLVPLDSLAPSSSTVGDQPASAPLSQIDRLLIAQPRGLSPADNVALDDWVHGGGHLLYILDPMLTGDYAAPLGDPRNPVFAAMIPPVFKRWGLSVQFDERQPLEPVEVETGAGTIPVMMAGQLLQLQSDDESCRLEGEGILAECRIGKGKVTVLADAFLLESPDRDVEGSGDALDALTIRAFE